MGYSNTWDNTIPLDVSDADLIAADIRALKVDIQERINSIIGVAVGTAFSDPVVDSTHNITDYRTELTALNVLLASQTKNLYIGGSDVGLINLVGAALSSQHPTLLHDLTTMSTGMEVIWPINLPVGCVITGITTYYKCSNISNTLTMNIGKNVLSTGIRSVVSTGFVADTSTAVVKATAWTGLGTFNITDGEVYSIGMVSNPAAAQNNVIYGHKVTYTSANANVRF